MSALLEVLLVLLQAVGVLLLAALVLLGIALVIPVSVWIAYEEEQLTVQAGALGLRFTLLPRPARPKKKKRAKPKKKKKKAAAQQTPAAAPAETASQAAPPAQEPTPQKEKNQLLQLTFAQLVTLVKGLGTLGRRVVAGLRIKHIRLHLYVTGKDAADTALQYGKLRAWLHTGVGILNNALWLEFDQFQIDTDFLAEKQKKPAFSCQISAQLLIMGIAALRFLWLLWKEDLLDVLLAQLPGNQDEVRR